MASFLSMFSFLSWSISSFLLWTMASFLSMFSFLSWSISSLLLPALDNFSEMSAEVIGELVEDLVVDLGAGLSAGVRTMSREIPPGVFLNSSGWRVLRGVLGVVGLDMALGLSLEEVNQADISL